jgi:hypothetical protein
MYETTDQTFDAWDPLLMKVLNNPTVTTVNSVSYGACELYWGPSRLDTLHHDFDLLATHHQVFFASTGDSGKICDPTTRIVGPDYPASDPLVTAVGGTNLFLNNDNSYAFEYAWSESGDGVSSHFARPAWQVPCSPTPASKCTPEQGVPPASQYAGRLIPDVSADAYASLGLGGKDYDTTTSFPPGYSYPNPSLGYSIYTNMSDPNSPGIGPCTTSQQPDSNPPNCWFGAGGTSAASPLWAALVTLYNQYAAHAGKQSLNANVNQQLYNLASHDHKYAGAITDITFGAKDGSDLLGNAGPCPSGAGQPGCWDFATGVGSPEVYPMVLDLPGMAVAPADGKAGSAVTLSGDRYLPGETVKVKDAADGSILCTATVASGGTFSCNATIPSTATSGFLKLVAKGETSAEKAATTFDVAKPRAIDEPRGITAGPDGALWFVNEGDSGSSPSIGRITTAGVVKAYRDPSIGDPEAITTGSDGALWFTNPGSVPNSIGRITTSGVVSHYTDPSIKTPLGIGVALYGPNYRRATGDHHGSGRSFVVHKLGGRVNRPDHDLGGSVKLPGPQHQ